MTQGMRRWFWLAVSLAAIAAVPAPARHRHPAPMPTPWTDRRPVVKQFDSGGFQISRPRYYWLQPSYLETAPVVFPDPAPTLPPLFRK